MTLRAHDIDLPGEILLAGPAQQRKLASITADAFRHDPFNRWLFGNYAGIANLFRLQARLHVQHGYCYTMGDDGACMWLLPGQKAPFGLRETMSFALPTLFLCGPQAVRRGMRTGDAMAERHPAFEHAYLFSIGLRPRARGKGLGRKLIDPVLAACDRAQLPAYLENSNPQNTGFYRSCGFEVMGEPIHPEPGSPPLVPMLRQPRQR